MQSYEGVIVPDGPLFLVQKGLVTRHAYTAPSGGRRRSDKPQPSPSAAAGSRLTFVSYNAPSPVANGRKTQRRPGRPPAAPKDGPSRSRKKRDNGSPLLLEHKQKSPVKLPTSPLSGASADGALAPVFPFDVPSTVVGHVILYVNYYFHALAISAYPLSALMLFNPAQRDWLPRALTDEVWCFMMLSASAGMLAETTGNTVSSQDSAHLLDEALRKLNARLGAAGHVPSDETLAAVSCLCMWGNAQNKPDFSWLHARGLTEMIHLRGGLRTVDQRLRTKVYRGILDTAVDSDQAPPLLLDFASLSGSSLSRPGRKPPSPSADAPQGHVCAHSIPVNLDAILRDVAELNGTIQDAPARGIVLDPELLEGAIMDMHQHLLVLASAPAASAAPPMSDCQHATRLALSLYLKSLSKPLGYLQATSAVPVSKLRGLMASQCVVDKQPPITPLTRWKLVVGAMAACDGTPERKWFLCMLAAVMRKQDGRKEDGNGEELKAVKEESRETQENGKGEGQESKKEEAQGTAEDERCSWDDLKQDLQAVMWVPSIHDDIGREIWSRATEA